MVRPFLCATAGSIVRVARGGWQWISFFQILLPGLPVFLQKATYSPHPLTLKMHKWQGETPKIIMHYAISITKHTGRAPFPPKPYAFLEICIFTICIITISTVYPSASCVHPLDQEITSNGRLPGWHTRRQSSWHSQSIYLILSMYGILEPYFQLPHSETCSTLWSCSPLLKCFCQLQTNISYPSLFHDGMNGCWSSRCPTPMPAQDPTGTVYHEKQWDSDEINSGCHPHTSQ